MRFNDFAIAINQKSAGIMLLVLSPAKPTKRKPWIRVLMRVVMALSLPARDF